MSHRAVLLRRTLLVGAFGIFGAALLVAGVLVVNRPDIAVRVPVLRSIVPADSGATPTAPPAVERLYTESFSDLLSGDGWIDVGRTTMYHDLVTTGYLFPPTVTRTLLLDAEGERVRQLADAAARAASPACRHGRCVTVRDAAIFLDGVPVTVSSFSAGTVQSVRVAAFDGFWVAGFVVRRSPRAYDGYLFRFDGTVVRAIPAAGGPAVHSAYEGTFGFGGTDDDWLAVYGAYEGSAVRVRGNLTEDASSFFGARVMRGGFEPAVVRQPASPAKRGEPAEGQVNGTVWYVWSRTEGTLAVVKLWDIEPNRIGGATDLTSQIMGAGELTGEIAFGESGGVPRFVVRVKNRQGERSYWAITDTGLAAVTPREVVSKNVHPTGGLVRRATLSVLDSARASGVTFSLSNDGERWQEVREGQEAVFTHDGSGLFWRAVFVAPSPGVPSPFFGGVHLEYGVVVP
ncbi:MAG: hypothetical protein Q7S84_04600 [bacterium]|nr:hypothetical protein [bacterium]